MKNKTGLLLILITAFMLFTCNTSTAEVKLPHLFSDGMVLQRGMPVKVWGTAAPGEKIKVKFLKVSREAVAGGDGKWSVVIPEVKAGGPYAMEVNEIKIGDILVGDVYLFSGQSNVDLTVSRVMDMFADEVNSYENTRIRHFNTPVSYNYHGPREELPPCGWKTLEKENVMAFSALCYFFSKKMYEATGVPVGIIRSSVGGSQIETWMSGRSLEKFPAIYNSLGMLRSDEYMRTAELADRMNRDLWHRTLNDNDPGLKGRWWAADTDDNGWVVYDLFSKEWQRDEYYQPVNGSAWFRKSFDAKELNPGRESTLRMGCIVDADSVYVNGVFVGTTSYQYPPRIYKIPAGVLKPEGNVVAVRLVSNSGLPHFVPDKPYKVVQDGREVNLKGDWKFRRGAVMPALQGGSYLRWRPAGLFNTMIYPLFGYGIKGAVWYQGESNIGRDRQYKEQLPLLIDTWREGFGSPELPFFVVQLPEFLEEKPYPSEGGWADMREAQASVAERVPNTALVVGLGAGEWNDIHPLDKKTIAGRLTLAVRRLAYGEDIVASGPVYESYKAEGGKIIITFGKDGGRLEQNANLKGFAIAGPDKRFVWARAATDGDKVVVWSEEVADPKHVRYAWADNPGKVDLRNTDGLPAQPFRTDIPKN